MKLNRVVLSGQDYVTTLKALLPAITSEPVQAYHEFMGVLVEAIRYQDKAIPAVVSMIKSLDANLVAQYTPVRPQIVAVVRDLTMHLLYQAQEHQLYNDRAVLMYTYFRHPDYSFDDVMLTSILPLTWNGHLYEPPLL